MHICTLHCSNLFYRNLYAIHRSEAADYVADSSFLGHLFAVHVYLPTKTSNKSLDLFPCGTVYNSCVQSYIPRTLTNAKRRPFANIPTLNLSYFSDTNTSFASSASSAFSRTWRRWWRRTGRGLRGTRRWWGWGRVGRRIRRASR